MALRKSARRADPSGRVLRAHLLLLLLPFAVSPLGAAQADRVKGTATYVQHTALPPSALFEAKVEDVSRAGVIA